MTDQMDDPSRPPPGPSPRRIARIGSRVRRGTPFVGGLIAAFLAIALYGAFFPGPHQLTPSDVQQNIASALASVTPPPARSQLVYQAIQPSLVLDRGRRHGCQGQGPDEPRHRGRRRHGRRHPHRPPRRRQGDDDQAHVRRRQHVGAPRSPPASPSTTSPCWPRASRRRSSSRRRWATPTPSRSAARPTSSATRSACTGR